jgi:hypothetical protein
MGIRGIAPLNLNLAARKRYATNIIAQLLYPRGIMLISMK